MYWYYWNEHWLFRFAVIIIGYGTVALPLAALIIYVRRKHAAFSSFDGADRRQRKFPCHGCSHSSNTNELVSSSFWSIFLRSFAIGHPEYELVTLDSGKRAAVNASGSRRLLDDSARLLLYFAGLQTTLVSMGFLQERIMTQGYLLLSDWNQIDKFADTQFLVFLNRVFALILSGAYLFINWKREPIHVPPLYKHSFTSVSNTLSSWCQYEALKYVSFPTQTVCKASKVVPTMLMGFVVRGERYGRAECASALFLAFGASLFFFASNIDAFARTDQATTLSGLCLMFGYLTFDAFTLNWQKSLFDTRPHVSKYQMMFGVNTFSTVLCLVSLVEQGTLISSFSFLLSHEHFARDAFLLSLSGALGQVVIYMTIERFGPIVFAIMMTGRQILSIALSAFVYGHPMPPTAVIGLIIAFAAIFSNIYRQYFRNTLRRRTLVTQC
ncbi:Adenosine 3'-phospho 5'-phosphosulfate transporter 1 [Toxocara canis]|uniref:Adenosine 3'-phospho 5'-phosphosulfate transporter 1 n=1 Tax=Toxocara canis TaxID=6265 RepID=A0A0B2UZ32_TOXCA|nr:Adenosine 3'-phospho 5'-phosphosulfate transporter 1 [Toxocara canis]